MIMKCLRCGKEIKDGRCKCFEAIEKAVKESKRR